MEAIPFQGYTPDYEGYNSETQGNDQDNLIDQGGLPSPAEMKKMKIFMIISLFSWVLLLITGWLFLAVPDIEKRKMFWLYIIFTTNNRISELPLQIYFVIFFIIAIGTLLCVTAALVVFLYSIFIKKDFLVIGAMLGKLSKFHFIPLLCISAVFIIGESFDEDKGFKGVHYFFSLLFYFFSLVSLIYIYIHTKLEKSLYADLAIKHGAYASLITLLIHSIGYGISFYSSYIGVIEEIIDNFEDLYNWFKGCYITFGIIVGLVNMSFALYLKELVIALINLLMYIGMTIQLYKMDKYDRKTIYGKETGIINIIMIVLSACMFFFSIYKKFIGD